VTVGNWGKGRQARAKKKEEEKRDPAKKENGFNWGKRDRRPEKKNRKSNSETPYYGIERGKKEETRSERKKRGEKRGKNEKLMQEKKTEKDPKDRTNDLPQREQPRAQLRKKKRLWVSNVDICKFERIHLTNNRT